MGRTVSARIIFDKIPAKHTVSCNSMILAYTNAGDVVEAHRLFKEMPAKNVITCMEHNGERLHMQSTLHRGCWSFR
jgi:pentatricopeptide repeat protein